MSNKEYSGDEFARLEEVVRDLPREIRPGRDLWPEIEDRISISDRHAAHEPRWWNSPVLSAASLVIAASALTFALTRPGALDDTGLQDLAPQAVTATLDPGFLANRKRLENQLAGRLAELSPEMQGVVRQNLTSIRGSLREMSMALASDPDNADLQDLLLSTYEQELQVMIEIKRMPEASARRIDL